MEGLGLGIAYIIFVGLMFVYACCMVSAEKKGSEMLG
jgi:hypothetical protein